jgi:hypothetical protein
VPVLPRKSNGIVVVVSVHDNPYDIPAKAHEANKAAKVFSFIDGEAFSLAN